MTALGRILQVIGWLWIAVGFFGPAVNLPDVSVFPGIIILFISRVLRKQGGQATRDEDGTELGAEQPDEPRMLNTERPQRPAPKPKPTPKTPPIPDTVPEPKPRPQMKPQPELKPQPEAIEEERGELLERVLLASQEMAEESQEPQYPQLATEREDGPLTSAEMIARAHRRWDRKP